MCSISADQRATSWNVKIFTDSDPIAGIYQYASLLTVGDVARDLDLCLVFKVLSDRDDWYPVLLPRNTSTSTDGGSFSHIVLREADTQPFPDPGDGVTQYTYVFHSDGLCPNTGESGLHAENSPCYHHPPRPTRRDDPRYLAIGKPLKNGCEYVTAPLRSTRGRKRVRASSASASISLSQSRASSTSSYTSDQENTENPDVPLAVIPTETARPIVDKFRTSVLSGRNGCAISGKGKSWVYGVPGTGIEAAHIIPQVHWAVYPLSAGVIAQVEDQSQIEEAWRRTWSTSNGLPLLSHIHKCFDARLISINPQTRRIRAFVAYDILMEHHGRLADLPPNLDLKALRHHYDMCCVENLVAMWIPHSPRPSGYTEPPSWAVPGISSTTNMAPPLARSVQQAVLPPNTPQTSGHVADPPTGQTTHPPSPPCSDTDRKRVWMFGDKRIDDPIEAENIMRQGWILREIKAKRKRTSHERGKAGSERRWLCGAKVIKTQQEAEELTRQGWILREIRGRRLVSPMEQYANDRVRSWVYGEEPVEDPQGSESPPEKQPLGMAEDDEDAGYGEEPHQRGRPSKRQRCTATDDGSGSGHE